MSPADKIMIDGRVEMSPKSSLSSSSSIANASPRLPPPPLPGWLTVSIENLLRQYPNDSFEGIMRFSAVDKDTEIPVPIVPGEEIPGNLKFMFLPRIRCHDCPGRLYTPGPELTAGNFEVHLKYRQHRMNVEARVGKPTGPVWVGSIARNEVICTLRGQDGFICRKQCIGVSSALYLSAPSTLAMPNNN
ncbi:hypothetical protein GQ53DRAFT_845184 [Thozetella sp. PMI_491]|nr:hypothetical protein GQ53DRAFT_845184 [Thozetella sp. PMI_491]